MPEQIDHEVAIFQAAIELPTPQMRTDYLRKACGADLAMRERLGSLLAAHEHAGAFLEKPASLLRLASAVATVKTSKLSSNPKVQELTEKPGDYIGHYKLLQKIGEGGCGVVYMAEQGEPVRRRVAVKIIKMGMDTRQVIARFEAERQALAMMDHPNIARVLDAGATETGRPFFVMDLVRGIRMTDYCDRGKLATRERLALFSQVCHAIQHAHQKGIIHRDIKPSNILVTLQDGRPLPVIIDFGIAKATEQRLTDKTLFTAFEQFIGTPAYMSPEQAEMSRLDIDTRSDIYSLGVLLYELLTGKTPFDGKTLLEAGIDQMRRTIREKEPLRPSTCLSTMLAGDLATVANHRNADPLRLIHLLRGDLDWIVMKCLEKDRTRRYETANGLALDIQRHLQNEPILARPPSRMYRFQKLVRRNKVAFGASTVVATALIIGLAVSTHLFMREREAYRRAVLAERNQNRLRQEAEVAHQSEAEQRRMAEENDRRSHLNSYAADIYSAFLALQSGNLGRTVDLLEHQVPQAGSQDLRGFEWRYLWQQAQGDELLSLPHPALVSCALFSGDGQNLITASYDGSLRVWDLGTMRVVKTISGFERQFGWHYLACSQDGRWLAGLRQGKLVVFDCSAPDYPVRFEASTQARVIAFRPDSTQLVGWGDAGMVLLDMDTWQSTHFDTRLKPGSFPCLAIDRSGKLAALAHEGSFGIEVWNLDLRMESQFFTVPSRGDLAFVSLAWSPDGLLAGTTWDGRLMLLDSRTGEERASTIAHAGSAFGLAFAPKGQILVTAGHDQAIHLWGMPDLEKLATLRGHRDEIWSLAFSRDGKFMCTAGKDGTAKLWRPEPKPVPVHPEGWYTAAFSSDGKSMVTLSEPISDMVVDLWDVNNPGVRTTKTLPVSDSTNLVRAVLSEDARLLGLARADGPTEVWSIDTGQLLQSTSGQRPPATALAFSSNCRLLAMGTASGTIDIWNLRTGQTTRCGSTENSRITMLTFTGVNQYLRATTSGRQTDLLFDLKTGAELPLSLAPKQRFMVSPDGKTIASAETNYAVTLLDLPSLRPRTVLTGHRWMIYSMAFSSDGKIFATGGADAVTRLWDVATGRELTRPLRGHLQGVTELAFSPDGKSLATGSTDGTVKLWHVATGRELFKAADASQPLFSPDGNTLLWHTSSGQMLLHVPTLAEIDEARQTDLADH